MLKKRMVLVMIAVISILGWASFISLIRYYDPYTNIFLAISLISISVLLAFGGIMILLIYFFKKIYYRGEVGFYHIFTSVRQAFLLSIVGISGIILYALHIPFFLPFVLVICIALFLELFIQSLG